MADTDRTQREGGTATADSDVLLQTADVRSGYEGVEVLDGIDVSVGREIFAVLGANGAGKSTLLRTLARLLPLTDGTIHFRGDDVSAVSAHDLARRGLAFVPQEGNVFAELTVRENLSVGSLIGDRSRSERLDEVFAVFPALADRLDQRAGTLSGGESQMVAVGRALMQDPQLLLLDEPTAGLAPRYVDNLFERIAEIQRVRSVGIVLAEQNATRTVEIADHVLLLALGRIHLSEPAGRVDADALREGYRI